MGTSWESFGDLIRVLSMLYGDDTNSFDFAAEGFEILEEIDILLQAVER